MLVFYIHPNFTIPLSQRPSTHSLLTFMLLPIPLLLLSSPSSSSSFSSKFFIIPRVHFVLPVRL